MPDLVTVRLLAPVAVPGGGWLNPGERAGFPAEEAASLIARGAAEPVRRPPVETRAPARPPVDRMARTSTRK